MAKAVARVSYWFVSVSHYPQVLLWMPAHVVKCVIGKKPRVGRIHHFLSKKKQAYSVFRERHYLIPQSRLLQTKLRNSLLV